MNSGYYPVVLEQKQRIQTASQQIPFYFGGSSVPTNLNLSHKQYSGSGYKKTKLLKLYNPVNDINYFKK
jgi:hypothetical protein